MLRLMSSSEPRRGRRARTRAAGTFRSVEHVLYFAIAIALGIAGATLFVFSVYDFASSFGDGSFVQHVLALLDSLLLVFIVTELLHTVRAVIDENVLMTEPFLIVGIVAVIRRLIVISAEAPDFVGREAFGDFMLELGILVGAVLGLGTTIFLLRHTEHSEPRPAHEGDRAAY